MRKISRLALIAAVAQISSAGSLLAKTHPDFGKKIFVISSLHEIPTASFLEGRTEVFVIRDFRAEGYLARAEDFTFLPNLKDGGFQAFLLGQSCLIHSPRDDVG